LAGRPISCWSWRPVFFVPYTYIIHLCGCVCQYIFGHLSTDIYDLWRARETGWCPCWRPFSPPAGGAVIAGVRQNRGPGGCKDTPAWERERQTHLRQWGQHRAAGWLYLVAGREEAGSPCSHGHAAGARMWSPLPRRCPDLRHGAGDTHGVAWLSAVRADTRPSPGHARTRQPATRREQRLFPARRRRGDHPLPAECAIPSATQEPRGRSGLAARHPAPHSSVPLDTLTASEARPRRPEGWSRASTN